MEKPHYTYAQYMQMTATTTLPALPQIGDFKQGTFAWLTQRVLDDIAGQAGNQGVKQIGESQMYAIKAMQRMPFGQKVVADLKRTDFIEFIKWRRNQPTKKGKVGPATAKQSLTNVSVLIKYACATWDDCANLVPVIVHLEAACEFLEQRGIIAKANRRTRRVEDEEVVAMLGYYEKHPGRTLRMKEVIAFCLASGRRRGEVCRITWGDVDFENKVYWVRDVKHPTKKAGNHKSFILFPVIEAVIRRQIRLDPNDPNERIFPFVPGSVTQSFIIAKKAIAKATGDDTILSLRLHDHRAEAISKWLMILESAEDVAMCVSGHNGTRTLKEHYDRRNPQEVMKAKYQSLMTVPQPSGAA